MLTALEKRHLDFHFPDIDPGEVQSRLGMGIEKVAFGLRTMAAGVRERVLKLLRKDTQEDPISYFVSPLFTTPVDETRRDIDMCVDYFEGAVVVPDIVMSTKDQTYCLLQDKLDMQMLTPDLCFSEEFSKHRSSLLAQLQDLLERDKKLQMDQGRFFDFQGWGLWRVLLDQIAMANVAVVWEDQKPKLKIFDLTLMHTPRFSSRGVLHMPGYFSNQRNNRRMLQAIDPASAV